MSDHKNFVRMSVSGTPGTGTITLGSAVSGYQSLATAYGANATVDVSITDGTAWEVARDCTYTHSGTTLTRGTLEESSTGSALSLTSAAVVSVTATAGWGNSVELQLDRGSAIVGNAVSTTQSLSSLVTSKLSTCLDSVAENTKTWWDTVNKRYLPLEAGNYAVGVFCQLDSVAADKLLQAQIWKNGVVFARGDAIASGLGGGINASASWIVPCNGSTDYIEAYFYNGDSVSRSTAPSVGRVGFFAYRL